MDGADLRALRKRFALTQRQVADAAGMRQPDLSAIENGRRGTDESRDRVLAAIRSLARPGHLLDSETRDAVRAVLSRYGADEIRLFGSVARGDEHPGSDVDLIARFPAGFDLLDLMNVEAELEALLGLRVDVVADGDRTPFALVAAKREAVPL